MRLRLLFLVTGTGALLSGLPCAALTTPDREPAGPVRSAASESAVALLRTAATTARTRAWSGTQHVLSVRDGRPTFTVLQLQHTPGTGSAVQVLGDAAPAVAADVLDARLLGLLADHYDLRIAGPEMCAGRAALLVEARRPGRTGTAAVAGRFWVDRATRLVLRREVLDAAGSVIRSSAFVDLRLGTPDRTVTAVLAEPVAPTGQRLDDAALEALEGDGWPVVRRLPSGLELFEARLHEDDGDVLQLAYSDGLSTLSLFVQEGELPDDPDGTPRSVGGGTVWASRGTPQRVVWSGEGRTWTLMSDAPAEVVSDAVLVLPHAPVPQPDDGVASRVWRGMSRVGGWLNPFA